MHIRPVSHSVIASFLALVTSTLACGQSWGFDFGPEVRRNRIVTADDMLHSAPLVPRDIYRKGLGNGARHDDLATFAWLEFIALNASVGSRRGTPGGSFAAAGVAPTARLVWETYHHRAELLPYNRTGPVPPNGLSRGLFKRLDGVIAYPKEITNPRLPFIVNPEALQRVCARYDC